MKLSSSVYISVRQCECNWIRESVCTAGEISLSLLHLPPPCIIVILIILIYLIFNIVVGVRRRDISAVIMHLLVSSINLTILLKPGEFFRLFRISISDRFSSSCSVRMWFSLIVSSWTYAPKCSIVFSPSVK